VYCFEGLLVDGEKEEPVMPGPATTCTAEVRDLIVHAVQKGALFETAAAYAGIEKETFRAWLKKGRAGKSPYDELVAGLDMAVCSFEVNALRLINAHACGDWHAAAWLLERKFPERWGRKWQTTGPELAEDGTMLTEDQLDAASDDELLSIIDAVAKVAAKREPTLNSS
jgi:transposase